MKQIVLAFSLLSLWHLATAQVYLQLERAGTLKTLRYSEGDVLTFRLKNDDKGWHERTIASFDIPGKRIVFSDVLVPLDSIDAIRLDKKAMAAQFLGTAMQTGGINMILFTGYDAVFREGNVDFVAMGSSVLNIVAGSALKKIFEHSVFRISPRKRLRLLDLSFHMPPPKT